MGYGKTRKTDLTSPMSSAKENEIKNTGATNLTQALQGKAAGVYVSQAGGAPGEQVNICVRGGCLRYRYPWVGNIDLFKLTIMQ